MKYLFAFLAMLPIVAHAYTHTANGAQHSGGSTGSVTISCTAANATIVLYSGYNPGGGATQNAPTEGATTYVQMGMELSTTSSYNVIMWYATAQASGSHTIAQTFTANSDGTLLVVCIDGAGASDIANTSTLVGIDNGFPGTAANAYVGHSITTTAAGDDVLGFFECVSSCGGTWSAGTISAFTGLSFGVADTFGEYFTQSTAGPITATATNTANQGAAGITVAVKSGGVPTVTSSQFLTFP